MCMMTMMMATMIVMITIVVVVMVTVINDYSTYRKTTVSDTVKEKICEVQIYNQGLPC